MTPEANLHAWLEAHRLDLIAYLRSKTQAEDWHAVADAACDLREIEAKIQVLSAQPLHFAEKP